MDGTPRGPLRHRHGLHEVLSYKKLQSCHAKEPSSPVWPLPLHNPVIWPWHPCRRKGKHFCFTMCCGRKIGRWLCLTRRTRIKPQNLELIYLQRTQIPTQPQMIPWKALPMGKLRVENSSNPGFWAGCYVYECCLSQVPEKLVMACRPFTNGSFSNSLCLRVSAQHRIEQTFGKRNSGGSLINGFHWYTPNDVISLILTPSWELCWCKKNQGGNHGD